MTIFVLILLIAIYLAEQWSLEHSLNGIEYSCRFSKLLVKPDEEFELVTTIKNTSLRFVPFLKIVESLPADMKCLTEKVLYEKATNGNNRLVSSIYLMPRGSLERRVKFCLPARGRYVFRGADIRGGDFLGLNEKIVNMDAFSEIVVYPKEITASEILSVMGGFMGDISVRRFIIEDPILTIGTRGYTGREPMKSISWKHSARTGELMVKQFDYTIEPSITVLLDIEHNGDNNEGVADLIETAYSLTRTVCQSLEDKGMKYDFLTNATVSNTFSRWSYLSESIGTRHFNTILEGLGRASYYHVESFESLINTLVNKQDRNRSTIIITLDYDNKRRALTDYLEKTTGGKVFMLNAREFLS